MCVLPLKWSQAYHRSAVLRNKLFKKLSSKIITSNVYGFSHWHSKHFVGSGRFRLIFTTGLIVYFFLPVVVGVSSHSCSVIFGRPWCTSGNHFPVFPEQCVLNEWVIPDVLNSSLKCFLLMLPKDYWYLLCARGCCQVRKQVPLF